MLTNAQRRVEPNGVLMKEFCHRISFVPGICWAVSLPAAGPKKASSSSLNPADRRRFFSPFVWPRKWVRTTFLRWRAAWCLLPSAPHCCRVPPFFLLLWARLPGPANFSFCSLTCLRFNSLLALTPELPVRPQVRPSGLEMYLRTYGHFMTKTHVAFYTSRLQFACKSASGYIKPG